MSLPLVPAILASIALITDLTEAKPAIYEDIEKRSLSFSNSAESTKKTSTTKKATTTTKKASATKASSSSGAVATSSGIGSSFSSPSLTSYSSGVLAVSTGISATSNSITASTSSSPTQSASKSSGGLSGGAIGAIVAVIVIIIAGAAAYLVISKRKKNKAGSTRAMNKPDPFTMGFGSDGGFNTQPYNTQPPMQTQTNTYQAFNQPYSQPKIAASSPTSPSSPYYSNNPSNTQFHDANNHIIAESMMPTIVPQAQYQPQLQPQTGSENQLPNTSLPARMPPTQAGSLGVFFVVATYTPTLSDEIDIQINDQVELLVEYDDGWCQGINLTRGHAKGVFPSHCIENGSNGNNTNDVDRLKRVSSMYMG